MKKRYLVSACLAGEDCKYNGKNNLDEKLMQVLKKEDIILVCPEVLGGLFTPRAPAEIQGGQGKDVLLGTAKVINTQGDDVSATFVAGARAALKIAKDNQVTHAIFQSRSPSCGVGEIYDGTFTKNKIKGDGVTVALLKEHGIAFCSMPCKQDEE